MIGIASTASASTRARARATRHHQRPTRRAANPARVRSPRSSRATARVSTRPPKGETRRAAIVWQRPRRSGDAAGDDNAYTRFREGISDDEREAVKESWDKIMRWGSRRHQKDLLREDVLAATTKVGVMGGGSFGTAMATLLARNKPEGLDVVILVRSEKDADAINDTHRNAKYLPEYELPEIVRATVDPSVALAARTSSSTPCPCRARRRFWLA